MTFDVTGLTPAGGGSPAPAKRFDTTGLTPVEGSKFDTTGLTPVETSKPFNADTWGWRPPKAEEPKAASDADGGGFFSELGKSFKRTIMRDNPQSMADALEMGSVLAREEGPAAAGAKVGEMVRPKGEAPAPMREERDPLGDYAKTIKDWIKTGDDGGKAAVPEIRNIRSPSDALSWFGSAIGSAAGSSAPSIGTGLATAAITKNPVAGFFAGAFGPSYVQNSGDTYATLRDDPGVQAAIKAGKITDKEVAGWAAVASVPIAALDAYGAEKVLPLKKLKGELMSRLVKRIALGGLAEGGTEGFQQVLQEATLAAVGGDHTAAQAAYNVFENFAQGTVGGTAMGAAGEALVGEEAPERVKDDTIMPGITPEEELDAGEPLDPSMTFVDVRQQGTPPEGTAPPPPPSAAGDALASTAPLADAVTSDSDKELLRQTLGDDVDEIAKPGGELLNTGDIASPLPTEDIREGKKIIDDLIGTPAPAATAEPEPQRLLKERIAANRARAAANAAPMAQMRGGQYPIAPRSEWYGEGTYEQDGGTMTSMTPDEFLKQARPLTMDPESRENIDLLKEHIQSGKTLDPLKFDAKGKEDGRHRAIAAKELGIKEVPVIDYRPATRIRGEEDKVFAKRVVDKRPAPETLPEKHDDYFVMDEATVIPLDKLISTKSAEENKQGGDNGAKRMAAAAKGELSKREPITVEPVGDGTYRITDGNGTFTTVQKYGWKGIPVKIENVERETGQVEGAGHLTGFTGEIATPSQRAPFYVHPYRTVDALLEDAHARQDELVAACEEIGGHVRGVTFKNPGIKDKTTLEEKIPRKGYYDAGQITDAIRVGFEVSEPGLANQIIRGLARHFEVLDEGWLVVDTGYFDRKVLVRFDDGRVGEVQIWEPNLLKSKSKGLSGIVGGERGSDLYDEWRDIKDRASPRKVELHRLMNELYAHALSLAERAWATVVKEGKLSKPEPKYLNLRRQLSSDMRAQELTTSSKSASTQSVEPGLSSAFASKSEKTTGRSSQLQNFTTSTSFTPNVIQNPPNIKGEEPAAQRALKEKLAAKRKAQAESAPKAQARTLRDGTETPDSIGLPSTAPVIDKKTGEQKVDKTGVPVTKKAKHNTFAVATALQDRQRAKYGTIERNDRSVEAQNKIANWMVAEVDFEMLPERQETSGAGWYSWKYQRALDAFAAAFPEIGSDAAFKDSTLPGVSLLKNKKNARNFLTALVAITSDGTKVKDNFKNARRLYEAFRTTGTVPTDFIFGGKANKPMRANAANINQLLADRGPEGMHTFMMGEATVRELGKLAKAEGVPFSVKYQPHIRLPMAAIVFGPKLGAFYANLMGAHGYLTMDRWWNRTFNRYRGQLLTVVSGLANRPTDRQGKKIGLAKFKETIGQPDISDDAALVEAVRHARAYEDKGFKRGTDIEKAANTIKKDMTQTEDQPFGSVDRTFQLSTTERARQMLADRGQDISIADIQAILWYFEKRLYGDLGARQTADTSYADAAADAIADVPRGDAGGGRRSGDSAGGPDASGVSVRGEQGPAAADTARKEVGPKAKLRQQTQSMLDDADEALGPAAQEAVSKFVGHGPKQRNATGAFGEPASGIMNAMPMEAVARGEDPALAAELEKAFAPVREQLRKEFGDTVTLHRVQGEVKPRNPNTIYMGFPEDARRTVLSWSSDPEFAEDYTGARPDRPLYTEAEITAAEKEHAETGKVKIPRSSYRLEGSTPYTNMRGNPATSIDIYDSGGHVTDTGSVREFMEGLNDDRREYNEEQAGKRSKIVTAEVALDDVMWVTDRAGQEEFIVRNNPDSSAYIDETGKLQKGGAKPKAKLRTDEEPDSIDEDVFDISEGDAEIYQRVRLTPEFVAEAKALEKNLRALLDKMGLPQVGIRVAERIDMFVHGRMSEANATHFARLITVALNSDVAFEDTVTHEVIHALRELDVFTDTEWAILSRKSNKEWRAKYRIKQFYGDRSEATQIEEGIAEAFSRWAKGEKMDGVVAKAFRKLQSVMRAIRTAFSSKDYTTAEDIFAKVASGKIGKRAGKPGFRRDPMFQAAWHGSPHDFDEFSLAHMGSGEGAQAYGWGLYFAGRKAIAEYYRDKLSAKTELHYEGKARGDQELSNMIEDTVRQRAPFGKTALSMAHPTNRNGMVGTQEEYDAMTTQMRRLAWAALAESPRSRGDVARRFDSLIRDDEQTIGVSESERTTWDALRDLFHAELDKVEVKAAGKLYKVDIPEDSEMLNYDAPLNRQPEAIQKIAHDLIDEHFTNYAKEDWNDALTGLHFYRDLSSSLGGDRKASEALRAAGIPGHRYLDSSSRHVAGNWVVKEVQVNGETRYQPTNAANGNTQQAFATRELADQWVEKNKATHNYVIYDDARIKVEAKARLRGLSGGFPSMNIAPTTQRLVNAIKSYRNEDTTVPETMLDYNARKWTDYLRPLLTLMKQAGASIPDQMNAYSIARRALDAAAVRIIKMHERFTNPMMHALSEAGATLEDLHNYSAAKHIPERNRVVGLRNEPGSDFYKAISDPTIPGASGWSRDEARQMMRDFNAMSPEKQAGIKEAHRLQRAMLAQNLQNMLDGGLISQSQYDDLTQQYTNYVPLMGEELLNASGNFSTPGAGKGFDVRGKEYKGATGRFSKAENIPAYASSLSERTHIRAAKNEIGKALLRFVNHMIGQGNKDIAEVYWTEASPIQDPDMVDVEKAQAVYKRELDKNGKVVKRKVPPSTISPDMFATKVGGRQIYIKFADPKIGLALKNMSATQLGLLLHLSRKITNWQSMVNTRINPVFIPFNFMRDIGTAFIHLLDEKEIGFSTAEAGRTVMKITKSLPAIWRKARGKAPRNQYDTYLQEWENHGGRLIYNKTGNIEDTINDLRTKLLAANDKSTLKKVWPAFRDFFADFNDTIENGIRLSTYVELRKKGWSADKAALASRDLTVDFRQHGELGPKGNALFAFFNASIIGNVNVAKRLVRSKRVRRAAYAAVAMGVAMDLLNRALSGDADDGEDEYEKLLRTQPWVFERSMVIFYSPHAYIKIPMPFGYNSFYHMGLQGSAAAHGNVSPLDAMANSTRVMADSFNPMGGTGNFWSMIMPTALDPFDEIRNNSNFAGNPIYPKQMPGETTPASQKSFRSTPWGYKKIAEFANSVTGGNEVEPGGLDIHPDSIQHVVDFAIGGLGRFVQDIVNPGLNLAAGEDPHFEKLPYVKQLSGEADNADAKRSEFYDLREQVEKVESYQKKHRQRGKEGKADLEELEKNYPVEIDSIPAFNAASKQLKQISKRRRNLEGNDKIDAAERRRREKDIDEDEAKAMNRARIAYAKNRQKDAE